MASALQQSKVCLSGRLDRNCVLRTPCAALRPCQPVTSSRWASRKTVFWRARVSLAAEANALTGFPTRFSGCLWVLNGCVRQDSLEMWFPCRASLASKSAARPAAAPLLPIARRCAVSPVSTRALLVENAVAEHTPVKYSDLSVGKFLLFG